MLIFIEKSGRIAWNRKKQIPRSVRPRALFPSTVISLQCPVFFHEHVLLLASGKSTKDQLALLAGVRRQPLQWRDPPSPFLGPVFHWLPCLVASQGHGTWLQSSGVGEEQSLMVARVRGQLQKKTGPQAIQAMVSFISSVFLDMDSLRCNRLKILCNWAQAD